ncbi:hypothetical protein WG904_03415 [Pedobacter sp. Du54]|uniref:hypothetical protein n=1 Tax=Pedobacter anseongensis TaxID=3133439 RepID=UPI0030A7F9DA
MEIDLLTKKDLEIFEKRLFWHLNELSKLITNRPIEKSETMTIEDINREYGISPYTQRVARSKGDLSYEKLGLRDITYRRTDVEAWINKKTIKSQL